MMTEGESRVRVRPGQMVTFRGRVKHHDGQFPEQVGVDTSEGAMELRQDTYHIEVPEAELQAK
jgi:hypothetical protein